MYDISDHINSTPKREPAWCPPIHPSLKFLKNPMLVFKEIIVGLQMKTEISETLIQRLPIERKKRCDHIDSILIYIEVPEDQFMQADSHPRSHTKFVNQ